MGEFDITSDSKGKSITHTGVFLPNEIYEKVKRLMEPKITMNFETNITVTKPGDKEAAWKLVDDYALKNGLPSLPDRQHYGLTSDRELVSIG